MPFKIDYLNRSGKNNYLVLHRDSDHSKYAFSHFHEEYEVYILRNGTMHSTVNGQTFEFSGPGMLLINGVDIHYNTFEEGVSYDRYVVLINPQTVSDLNTSKTNLLSCFLLNCNKNEPRMIPLSLDEYENLIKHCEILKKISEQDKNTYGKDMEEKLLLGLFLISVNRQYMKTKGLESKNNEKTQNLIYAIISFIKNNYQNDILLEDIAKAVGFNRFYMCKVFNENTGLTIMSYLSRYRIQKAKNLLEEGKTIEETSRLTGFKNASSFSRTFKHMTNLGPKHFQVEFRKSNKDFVKT